MEKRLILNLNMDVGCERRCKMMDFAKYEVKMELPRLGFKPVLSNFSPSVEELEEYKKKLEEYERRKKEYKEKFKEYRAEKQRLIEQFKKDAFKELGIENFPEVVKEKVFEIAWEEGHSEGFYRVYEKMEVLVDFLKTFKKECKGKKSVRGGVR